MTHSLSVETRWRGRRLSSGLRRRELAARIVVLTFLLLGLTQPGRAGEITVQISKRHGGNPVQAAAVCLGTPANPAQFGAMLADDRGTVRFDKVHARTGLLLTVSKSGYKGRQIAIGSNSRDRGVLLTLASGGGGPECEKATVLASRVPGMTSPQSHLAPGVMHFQLNGGARTTDSPRVALDYVLSGEASHYRTSDRSDFASAQWRPLDSDLWVDLVGGAGLKTIYFQVGKLKSTEGAEIEILSNVAVDTIELGGG